MQKSISFETETLLDNLIEITSPKSQQGGEATFENMDNEEGSVSENMANRDSLSFQSDDGLLENSADHGEEENSEVNGVPINEEENSQQNERSTAENNQNQQSRTKPAKNGGNDNQNRNQHQNQMNSASSTFHTLKVEDVGPEDLSDMLPLCLEDDFLGAMNGTVMLHTLKQCRFRLEQSDKELKKYRAWFHANLRGVQALVRQAQQAASSMSKPTSRGDSMSRSVEAHNNTIKPPTPAPEPCNHDDGKSCFVGGLADWVDEKALIEFFNKSGGLEKVNLIWDWANNRSKCCALIRFSNGEAADRALQFNGIKTELAINIMRVNLANDHAATNKRGGMGGKGAARPGPYSGGKGGKGGKGNMDQGKGGMMMGGPAKGGNMGGKGGNNMDGKGGNFGGKGGNNMNNMGPNNMGPNNGDFNGNNNGNMNGNFNGNSGNFNGNNNGNWNGNNNGNWNGNNDGNMNNNGNWNGNNNGPNNNGNWNGNNNGPNNNNGNWQGNNQGNNGNWNNQGNNGNNGNNQDNGNWNNQGNNNGGNWNNQDGENSSNKGKGC